MILKTEKLSFKYFPVPKKETSFSLKEISFEINHPELVAIIGPNGSGKSTLLKTILGINTPYNGNIIIGNRNLQGLNPKELARRIAFVPQDTTIPLNLRVLDMVTMGRYPYQSNFSFESAEDIRISIDALRQVGIEKYASHPISTLSGGERQRAFIARALAQQANLLFLDEPTAFLDVSGQITLSRLLLKLRAQKNMTSLIITHNLHLASSFCNRIMLMKEGNLIGDGPPGELLTREQLEPLFETPFSEALFPAKN